MPGHVAFLSSEGEGREREEEEPQRQFDMACRYGQKQVGAGEAAGGGGGRIHRGTQGTCGNKLARVLSEAMKTNAFWGGGELGGYWGGTGVCLVGVQASFGRGGCICSNNKKTKCITSVVYFV